jgi:transcriptional regulator with XRE-family HTH domain
MLEPQIGEIIDKRGYRQNWIADQIGVSAQQLNNWITGKSHPRAEKLFELAKFLGVKVDDLYKWKEK